MAMRTHLEVQQREDIRRDLAERMKFVPPNLRAGENVSYWQEDPSKIQQGRKSLQSRASRSESAQVRPHPTVGHWIWKNFRTRVSDKERQCCGSLVMVKNVFGSCSLTTHVCAPSLIGKDFRSQLQLTFRTKKAESFSPRRASKRKKWYGNSTTRVWTWHNIILGGKHFLILGPERFGG